MFDFHEKRKIRSFLYSKPTLVVLFLLTVFLSISVYNRYTVAREMGTKLEAKKSELEELKVRAEVLESKVKHLEDDRGIEEELRNRFDVAKEGEQVIILLEGRDELGKKSESEAATTLHSPESKKKSFFHRFKFW